jgi:hypothetical protein
VRLSGANVCAVAFICVSKGEVGCSPCLCILVEVQATAKTKINKEKRIFIETRKFATKIVFKTLSVSINLEPLQKDFGKTLYKNYKDAEMYKRKT